MLAVTVTLCPGLIALELLVTDRITGKRPMLAAGVLVVAVVVVLVLGVVVLVVLVVVEVAVEAAVVVVVVDVVD